MNDFESLTQNFRKIAHDLVGELSPNTPPFVIVPSSAQRDKLAGNEQIGSSY